MNAINFIQQHGVEKAREVVEGAPETATHFEDLSNELKQAIADYEAIFSGAKQ